MKTKKQHYIKRKTLSHEPSYTVQNNKWKKDRQQIWLNQSPVPNTRNTSACIQFEGESTAWLQSQDLKKGFLYINCHTNSSKELLPTIHEDNGKCVTAETTHIYNSVYTSWNNFCAFVNLSKMCCQVYNFSGGGGGTYILS